jgi:XapX domain-containing protein
MMPLQRWRIWLYAPAGMVSQAGDIRAPVYKPDGCSKFSIIYLKIIRFSGAMQARILPSIESGTRQAGETQRCLRCFKYSMILGKERAMYLISLGAGLLAGVLYGLIGVRSPAPPAIALLGLLGMLLGEQAVPLVKHLIFNTQ